MVVPLLLGPLIGLVRTIVGLVMDFVGPLAVLAGGTYVADRLGIIDVSALLADFLNQYLDPSALLDVLGVVV